MARLRDAIYKWNHRLVDIERGDYGRAIGLRRKVAGETQWLIPKNTLIKELGLRSRYTREIEPLIQRDFMETNEQSRGTMKIKLRDRSERFFALWPDRIKAYWEALPDGDGLSQFPTNPSVDSEVAENE